VHVSNSWLDCGWDIPSFLTNAIVCSLDAAPPSTRSPGDGALLLGYGNGDPERSEDIVMPALSPLSRRGGN
jgi:hypothetical protein